MYIYIHWCVCNNIDCALNVYRMINIYNCMHTTLFITFNTHAMLLTFSMYVCMLFVILFMYDQRILCIYIHWCVCNNLNCAWNVYIMINIYNCMHTKLFVIFNTHIMLLTFSMYVCLLFVILFMYHQRIPYIYICIDAYAITLIVH